MSESTTNETVLNELITSLKNQKRPETIQAPIYGLYSSEERVFIYSDNEKKYNFTERIPDNKEVRNVKAFALSISEELKRRGNKTGEKATVNINLNGGVFIPDDDFGGYKIKFNRLNSQQWNLVKDMLNKSVNHRQFLLWLQGLKPSFDTTEFQELFMKFVQLKIVGSSRLISNPIITQNGQQEGYECNYALSDGTEGVEHFPTGFMVTVPFAKAGENLYEIPIELIFTRGEDNEIEITVLCAEFENIEEKAIIDEAEYIKQETAKYSELLVLSDF